MLKSVLQTWEKKSLINGALISVKYDCVIAKSKRVSALFKVDSSSSSNDSIRGAKFIYDENGPKHLITHFVPLSVLRANVGELYITADYIDEFANGVIDKSALGRLRMRNKFTYHNLTKSKLINLILDTRRVESFYVDSTTSPVDGDSIVTIYQTGKTTDEILKSLGIDACKVRKLDETTLLLSALQLEKMQSEAPYLIAMQVQDLAELEAESEEDYTSKDEMTIEEPTNEPVVGVIDTLFYEEVYFKKWVSFESCIHKDIPIEYRDYVHGTCVTSLIVDGPKLNPKLEDGCGHFRVRHFGVAKAGRYSSFEILKSIKRIVEENRDIKVWNLSLGSVMEIQRNYISPIAAELDRLQVDCDVIFVVAGTNKERVNDESTMRIGAPADSLNALVVNSVNTCGAPAEYTRVGPVLSFFHKPDVSYYGGTRDEKMETYSPYGRMRQMGTSFAAPWITRKLAYLIHKMHLSKEVAKALIVDSAAGWRINYGRINEKGYGVVPIRISDVLSTSSDEIKFIFSGRTSAYETYTYDIPVPVAALGYPYIARATLAYSPQCSRNQGVDYTNTELDVHFGPVKAGRTGNPCIESVDDNHQDDPEEKCLYEGKAREYYRKWDNVKCICDKTTGEFSHKKFRKDYLWGMSLKMKERLTSGERLPLPFAVVVTLKEIRGRNNYEKFVQLCRLRGWNVNEIDIDLNNQLYLEEEEDLVLESEDI
ncbi:MAG: S8 family peptidase [Akkermansia sp.]|nr:S8 family peptidase [Akkermansia sp.]